MHKLAKALAVIDRKPYKLYKTLQGIYHFPQFELEFDHIQGDPFATPSRISIRVNSNVAAFPSDLWGGNSRQLAMEDFLARRISRNCRQFSKGNRGSGNSGRIQIDTNGQQILKRNAVLVSDQGIEARLTLGLPAAGRSILSREAHVMLFEELPEIVCQSLLMANTDMAALRTHVDSNEDQDYLRDWLAQENLVAFIADGACLPRASGVEDRPLQQGAHLFKTPPTLKYTVNLPHSGTITGMGIPAGITVIVGGGFHGKSTLLHAMERGVYNHIPGDGRERIVTRRDAVKIRAEDGRQIHHVNISPFIDRLPFGKKTTNFSTDNASGSTSQAANIMEALECGCTTLLIDEDTSATNFMIRDERMQQLVAQDKEPITPLLHRVRELSCKHGISAIIVMGGSGDYLDVADTVIMMDSYGAVDVTADAHKLRRPFDPPISQLNPIDPGNRTVDRRLLSAQRGKHTAKIDVHDTRMLQFGEHRLDLEKVEQLVDPGQCRSIGLIMHYYAENSYQANEATVETVHQLLSQIENHGLDLVSLYKVGNLALPRLYEVMAAVNRIRPRH